MAIGYKLLFEEGKKKKKSNNANKSYHIHMKTFPRPLGCFSGFIISIENLENQIHLTLIDDWLSDDSFNQH